MKKQFSKFVSTRPVQALVGGVMLAGASAANAAVDISSSVGEAKADVATAGGLILGVIAAIAAIAWIRRVVK